MQKSFRIRTNSEELAICALKTRKEKVHQLMLETQYVSRSAHNSSTVYVHPITFGHLLDWWYKQLEGMEHIRTKHGENQPYFYFPWLNPRWEKKRGGGVLGACFGWWTKKLPLVWPQQFWLLHGFQSPIVFPIAPKGEKWRQIHGCTHAKILEDDCSFCCALRGAAW